MISFLGPRSLWVTSQIGREKNHPAQPEVLSNSKSMGINGLLIGTLILNQPNTPERTQRYTGYDMYNIIWISWGYTLISRNDIAQTRASLRRDHRITRRRCSPICCPSAPHRIDPPRPKLPKRPWEN